MLAADTCGMSVHSTFSPNGRVAVLIDGDNIAASLVDAILAVARGAGRADFLRVYGDAGRAPEWRKAAGFRFMDAGNGKNAADILLCLDAMELALAGDVGTFVIGSNDGDFTHLAVRLRERGLTVIGVGTTAAKSFTACCSRFVPLGNPQKKVVEANKSSVISPITDKDIRAMIARHSEKGQGMLISRLNVEMRKAHNSKISATPEKTWRAFLFARPKLYNLDPRGPAAKVRFKPKASTRSPSAPSPHPRTSPPPARDTARASDPRSRRAAPSRPIPPRPLPVPEPRPPRRRRRRG